MFRIIKLNNVEYSENSNGIFFDINHVDSSIFSLLVQCIERSKEQKRIDKERIAEIEALKKV
jgi:ABC-type transporter Mla MlaB component